MARKEQIDLSDFIKSVHQKLRQDITESGFENAWKNHCQNEGDLKKYAKAMYDLSNKWKENDSRDETKTLSRISWICNQCLEYIQKGGREYQRNREKNISLALNIHVNYERAEFIVPYKLLDVGSCYNPMKNIDIFDIMAIDLFPANSDVYKCDFLNVELHNSNEIFILDKKQVNSLKKSYFHIVVFSLLLEYIPCAKQRLNCCKKAYDLLVPEGILCIVTPDAKHVGANAKFMKSWRFLLAQVGFMRIKYEKFTYIHCMIYRKNINPKIAQRWATLNENKQFYSEMYIPQDFNNKGIPK